MKLWAAKKPVRTFTTPALQQAADDLVGVVRHAFDPQLTLGIATGGAVVSSLMNFGDETIGMECSMRRPGSTVNGRLGRAGSHASRLPYFLTDSLRRLEDRVLSASAPQRRHPSDELLADLRVVAKVVGEQGLNRILVVDDAVDSGATLACVRENLERLVDADLVEIRTCAITVTRSSMGVLELPDYSLFSEVLCRFPWSSDFRKPR